MNDSLPTTTLVEAALAERGIRFERRSGPVLHIPHGSAEVMVGFDDLAGATVIRVSAVVLDELGLSTDAEPAALRALNDRNRSVRFAKFVLEPGGGDIRLEYDLLGDYLQPEELINAVTSVAQMADDHDDLLRQELGSGRRAADR
jgi:hypothetical protein